MGESASVLARVLQNRRLRRTELAFLLFALGEYGVWLAVMVYAYRHGGITNAALIAVLQLIPAAVVAPLAARITDRRGGPEILLVGYLLQAIAISFTAAMMLTRAPAPLAYAGAVVVTSAVTLTRPAQAAALAIMVNRPDELTAANVLNGWADSGTLLAGPGLAGLLIGVDGSGLALAAFATGVGLAAWLVAPVGRGLLAARVPAAAPPAAEEPVAGLPEAADPAGDAARADVDPGAADGGSRGWLFNRATRAMLGLLAAEYVALGALDVIVVVLAVHALRLADSFAGYLDAAFGVGCVLGAVAATRLVRASSLARPVCAAAVAWAVSFALLGSFPALATALTLLAAAGVCRTLLDTAGRALLARVTPVSHMGRVFGMLEGMITAALAAGALLVPLLFTLGGVRLDLIGVGGLLVASALLVLGPMRLADRIAPAIDSVRRLHEHPLFAGLSLPALEELARELFTVGIDSGAAVVREGDAGDRFYLIAEGEFDVSIGDEYVRTLEPGDGFGEIALLRNVPRTATVTARGDGIVYGLGRGPFLGAMGAGPPAVDGLPGHAELDAATPSDTVPA